VRAAGREMVWFEKRKTRKGILEVGLCCGKEKVSSARIKGGKDLD